MPVEGNGGTGGTRVEYDAVETGADWFDRHAGSMKDIPEEEWQEFLRACRDAGEDGPGELRP